MYLGILGDYNIKQRSKKKLGKIAQKNKKISRKKILLQKFQQRNKPIESRICKILVSIFKMNKVRTQRNGSKENEFNDNAHSLIRENIVWFHLVWFYGIRITVGYLLPNPVFT